MGSLIRSFFQSLMKMFNGIVGMAGIAMVIYSLWMIHVWQRQTGRSPFDESDYPVPWFIFTFLGVGVILCLITCSGHIAAETLSGCCLYIDFPKDATGNFYALENFIRENFDFCKWIGLSVLIAQGLSFLLAMVLKALGPHRERCYGSDEEYADSRHPLLRNPVEPPPYVVVNPLYGPKK